MEAFPSNSKLPKPGPQVQISKAEPEAEEKPIDPVIEGSVGVSRRKKPLGRRFIDIFFGGQDAKSVGAHVFQRVLLPSAKDMFLDAVIQGAERMVYPEGQGGRNRPYRSSNGSSGTRVDYGRYSSSSAPVRGREDPNERSLSRSARANHNFEDIIIDSRVQADEVRDQMYKLIHKYEQVTVANLYRLLDITPSFTDQEWGWTDLRGFEIRRFRHGYLLDLPQPEFLKDNK